MTADNAIEPVDEIDIMKALYRKEQLLIDISKDAIVATEPKLTRVPDISRAALYLYRNLWAQIM